MKSLTKAAAAIALVLSAGSGAAQAATIYSNDFESGSTANLSGVTSIETAPSGEKFLGALSAGGASTLTLTGLGAYSAVTLSFNLYGLNSLDGYGTDFCCGPDYFTLKANGATLLDETFSNVAGWRQSYGGANSPGQTGATAIGTLGYFFYGPDSAYSLTFAAPVVAGQVVFDFIGATNQGWSDEGFGIDNIKVTAVTSGVPEPSTWAMMLIGFAGLAFATRRRMNPVRVRAA